MPESNLKLQDSPSHSNQAVDRAGTGLIGLFWSCALEVHLVDGTYELFRHYCALPSARETDGRDVPRSVASSRRCWA
jgi:hypothetical protein